MSYTILSTPAIILRIIPHGEASHDVVCFTQALGKITVRVQSSRAAHSKLGRYLTRLRRVTIEVLQGKYVWRLIGIHGSDRQGLLFQHETILHAWYRATRLFEFLVAGESPHEELFEFFDTLISYTDELATCGESLDGFEYYLMIHLMTYLGYATNPFSFPVSCDHIIRDIHTAFLDRSTLIKQINEGISASQIMVHYDL